MFNKNVNNANQGVFLGSAQGLATCLAIAGLVAFWPEAYDSSKPFVNSFLESRYNELSGMLMMGWAVLLGAGIFFLLRASLATSLLTGAVWVASRYI